MGPPGDHQSGRASFRGAVAIAAGHCVCFRRLLCGFDAHLLGGPPAVGAAWNLVGGGFGLCSHSRRGGLCHSLSQLLAAGNCREAARVFGAAGFLCRLRRCFAGDGRLDFVGLVWLDCNPARCRRTVSFSRDKAGKPVRQDGFRAPSFFKWRSPRIPVWPLRLGRTTCPPPPWRSCLAQSG